MTTTTTDSLRVSDASAVSIRAVPAQFPSLDVINELCLHDEAEVVVPHLQDKLLSPLGEFVSRPSKVIRASLVQAGFDAAKAVLQAEPTAMSPEEQKNLEICASVVEYLHAGSLIVDDVQDNSLARRGAPCYHRMHGVPEALTAGNWLYVWPLRLLRELTNDPALKNRLYEYYHDTLERAHYGQSLDVGIRVDEIEQAEVARLSAWVTRYKTGALTALALQLGASIGGASSQLIASLSKFGHDFGSLLQRYDDLGNFLGHSQLEKKHEDLKERRLSWVWAVVADHYDQAAYQEFKLAVSKLPDETTLDTWAKNHRFSEVARKASDASRHQLEEFLAHDTWQLGENVSQHLTKLCERLSYAYTKKL